MLERLTTESEPPHHYCHECAENVPAVILALQQAYDQELLIIWHDDRVTDEICAHCHRAIATIPAPSGLYEAEVTLTIQCRVTLTARSAPQAYYSLRYVLDTQKFEGMLAEAEETLSNVWGIEKASAEDCFYDLEPATSLIGKDGEEEDA